MVAAPVELVLVTCDPVMERDLTGQPAFGQKFKCAIHGSETDLRVFLAHEAEQLVGREMVARFQKRAQDRVALLGVLQTNPFQMAKEDFLRFAHGFARGRSVVVNACLHWHRKGK